MARCIPDGPNLACFGNPEYRMVGRSRAHLLEMNLVLISVGWNYDMKTIPENMAHRRISLE